MLEDDLTDILRKAKRGTVTSDADLAARTGLAAADLASSAAQRWEPTVTFLADVRHHLQDPHPGHEYLFFLEEGTTGALRRRFVR